jgi:uncharacterized protein (TIGR00299 family) protein
MGHEGHEHDPPGHQHGHEHAHAHAHEPHGELANDPQKGEELPAGAGVGRVLFLDAPSGLAGDMIVAALVDLGVPRQVVVEAIAALPLTGFHLHFGTRVRSGIVASSFEVHVEAAQPPRTYATIRAMLESAPLPQGVRDRAERTFRRLAVAEAKVHRTSVDDVHFHEVGAVDALADVVGSAAALAHLGADVVVSPLPLGRGFVKAAHGTLPLPAPATVECLAGFPTYDAGIDRELVTPTGAAIVGALSTGAERWPSMSPERVGWGAGSADFPDRPNVLRAILGSPSPSAAVEGPATHAVLEANVDDATGELAASWIEALLAAGALDAWTSAITMKKGRPALTLFALVAVQHAEAIAHAILRETTSLGVRRYDVTRAERPRRIVHVDTPYGPIPIKIAEGPFGPPQLKPEFDACAAAARTHGVPVREVLRVATAAAERTMRGT